MSGTRATVWVGVRSEASPDRLTMSEIPGMPDLPVLRHLTWREAHLFEMGLWPGIGVGIAVAGNNTGAALALVSVIRRRMQSEDQHRESDDLIRGYIRDAWYFALGAIAGFVFALVASSAL